MKKKKKILVILAVFIGLGILFKINPESDSFMPRCLFHFITGWDCPACGTQRALHQILHLNFRAGIAYNPFLFVSLPYLGALTICQWFNDHGRFDKLKHLCHHPLLVRTYLAALVCWWIFRNII